MPVKPAFLRYGHILPSQHHLAWEGRLVTPVGVLLMY